MPFAKAVGFHSPTLKNRSQGPLSALAEDFLVNTRLLRHDVEVETSIATYLEDSGVTMLSLIGEEDTEGLPAIQLPESVPLALGLDEALYGRSSVRNYTGDPINLAYLATIVRAASGISRDAEVQCVGGGSVSLGLRTVPSAGGLYPIDVCIAVINVSSLELGVYRYHPARDNLLKIGTQEALLSILDSFAAPEELISKSQANVVLLLIAHPRRAMRKYGDRGMRFVFHEAGAISQNVHLAVRGLGLGSVDCASLYDDQVHRALGIDGVCKALVHSIVIGVQG